MAAGAGGSTFTSVGFDGRFAFDGLEAGGYRLFVNAFTGMSRGAWVGGPTLEAATAFTVGEGTTDVGDVSGGLTKTVTVGLVDADGNRSAAPWPCSSMRRAEWRPRGRPTRRARSSWPPHRGPTPWVRRLLDQGREREVDVTTTSEVRLRLEPAAVVTATLKDKNGDPLRGVLAALYSGNEVVDVGFTGVDGTYPFIGLDPGNYTVKLYEALDRFELPAVALPATAEIGDPSAGQVSYTLDQTTVAITSGPPRLRQPSVRPMRSRSPLPARQRQPSR